MLPNRTSVIGLTNGLGVALTDKTGVLVIDFVMLCVSAAERVRDGESLEAAEDVSDSEGVAAPDTVADAVADIDVAAVIDRDGDELNVAVEESVDDPVIVSDDVDENVTEYDGDGEGLASTCHSTKPDCATVRLPSPTFVVCPRPSCPKLFWPQQRTLMSSLITTQV
jgi:hypothetical protein